METFAEDLFNVAEALNLDGFTLVGHSMGGATVTQFALDHQDLIKGLVLLNSTPLNGRTLKNGWEDELKENLLSPKPPAGDMGFDAAHVTEDFKEAVLADIAHNPVERFIGGRRSMAALRLRDRLRKIKIPTMVMGGDLDKTVGVDNILADYLALPEEVRHLSIFHQSGHSPNVDNGWKLAIVLERFSGMVWEEELKAESLSSE